MKKYIKKKVCDIIGYNDLMRGHEKSNKIFEELDKLERLEGEILWSQIFNNTIAGSEWLTHKGFCPGRWAVGYPVLYIMYRILNDINPKTILEMGLGESSKLTIQYALYDSSVSLSIIEQDENWLNFFSKKIEATKYTKILPVIKTEYKGNDINIYENLIPSIKGVRYDFIIIDGPWGSSQFSRHQILDIIDENLLAENFIIIMDDYNRLGEKQTIEEVLLLLKNKNVDYVTGMYTGMKDSFVICSPCYKFVISL